MLLYVEFISRRSHVSLEDFHRDAARAQGEWAGEHQADQIVLDVGRSWRVGPEPEYLCAWFSPSHDMDRIDDWERLFNAGEHDDVQATFDGVARIDRAGCYRPLFAPSATEASAYYVEWLAISPTVADADVVSAFQARTALVDPGAELVLLARPIGALAPGPHGIAAWALGSWGDAAALAESAPLAEGTLRVADASLYAPFGREQL